MIIGSSTPFLYLLLQYATFLRTLTSEDPSIPPGEREERVRRMERCLERMTDPTRSIVKQCYYDGKKYREVARERGITPDGVKKHIVKALRMLREELGCGEKRRGMVPGKTDET